MVDFHGFELPIWYESIQEEHIKTRNSAGVFDVSHMGFFRISGPDVRAWFSSVSTQDCKKFRPGKCGYTHFLDSDGYIIDDMIFAVSNEKEILGVPNSTMVETMFEWLLTHLPDEGFIDLEDLSEKTSIIALQGPKSGDIINKILGKKNVVSSFSCQRIADNPLGVSGWIQGTGYTGEPGVEIFIEHKFSEMLWQALVEDDRVSPVGLGARDTLRLEKGYLLSGQDFLWPGKGQAQDPLPSNFLARNTIETSVPYGLDINHDFIGKKQTISASKSRTRLWGMKCLEKGPFPRPGHRVLTSQDENAKLIGFITSGGPSPSLDMAGVAIGYLDGCLEGQEVWIQSSARRRVRALVSKTPFL